jgi:hypothetical protein
MNNRNDARELSGHIFCLSLFESNTAKLYQIIAEKIEMPIVKSLLLEVSHDSQKHAALLKGIYDSMPESNWNTKQCSKKIGQGWSIVEKLSNQIAQIGTVSVEYLTEFSEKLSILEKVMGEEYNVLVQMKTLEMMAKEIRRIYGIDIAAINGIIRAIIDDETHHLEILATIRDLFQQKKQELLIEDPLMEYRKLLG